MTDGTTGPFHLQGAGPAGTSSQPGAGPAGLSPPTRAGLAVTHSLRGTVVRVSGDASGTARESLLLASQEEGTVRIGGPVPFAMPGERLDMTGRWSVHPDQGRVFCPATVCRLLPSDVEGTRRFLSDNLLKTLGSVPIHRMIERFGGEALTILLEDPLRLTEIPGLPADKALGASDELRLKLAGRDAAQWLALQGVPTACAGRLVKRFGLHAARLLVENPYRLLEADTGLAFSDVDRIAFSGGVGTGSPERIRAAAAWAVRQAEAEGHACLPERVLLARLDALLGSREAEDASLWGASPHPDADIGRASVFPGAMGAMAGPDAAMTAPVAVTAQDAWAVDLETFACGHLPAIRSWLSIPLTEREPLVDVVCPRVTQGERRVYSTRMLEIERRVAARIRALLHARGRDDFRLHTHDWAMLDGLAPWGWDDLQKKVFRDAGRHGVIVITGGPGTGKTTLVKGLVRLFSDRGQEIALTAPTGRAARRLSDATGLEAKTVHRLLEVLYEVGGEETLRFRKDREDPLEADVIILDEASMLDLPLFDALLAACGDTVRLILVGDAEQLPSVGAGRVLGDLIDSGVVPVTRLEQVFRQSDGSRIAANAQAILRGEPLSFSDEWGEFHLVRRYRAEHVTAAVVQLCRQELPERYGFRAQTDIQVLSPMRKGTAGTAHLNRALQDALNPARPGQKSHAGYRAGDRVMQNRNDYHQPWTSWDEDGRPSEGEGVYNGDMGTLVEIDARTRHATIQFDDGREAVYGFDKLDGVEPAFAVTVHKSQGSEYPVVVLPLCGLPDQLACRNLLYTAVTRARRMVVIVGTESILDRMIANNRNLERYSGLAERLREGEME